MSDEPASFFSEWKWGEIMLTGHRISLDHVIAR
jgi:hypothetical protein